MNLILHKIIGTLEKQVRIRTLRVTPLTRRRIGRRSSLIGVESSNFEGTGFSPYILQPDTGL